MKILFIDGYFFPEKIAFSHLESDLMDCIVKNGDKIDVCCPVPTRGCSKDIVKEYSKKKRESLFDGNVNVYRYWAPQEKEGVLCRILRYFICYRKQKRFIRTINADVVLISSTPPLNLLLVKKIKKKRPDIKIVYNLQDVFPDSLINTSLTKNNSLMWKIGRRMEDSAYKYSDKIITISNGFKENLLNKGVDDRKIEVISNWIDVKNVLPIDRNENKLFDEFNICREKFIVLYAGNFGSSQGADIIIKVATLLKEECNIEFVVFGGGSEYAECQVKAKRLNLQNLKLLPLLSSDRISEVYSMGNVALIIGKNGVGNSGLPSKTWSIMACGTPIIASFDTDSELAGVIRDASAGVCVEPENDTLLAETIMQAYHHPLDSNGRDYVINNVSKEICVGKYIRLFKELQKGNKS